MNTPSKQNNKPRIAVVTMGVKLGDEVRGYTRFRALSKLLVKQGFEVDLITSAFQHWDKAHRDTTRACYQNLPYHIVFIDEPGYQKNLDLARIRSHRQAAKNLREYFESHPGRYQLIYAEIPPNDVARVCAEYAQAHNIPFVADVNDLWPEAMRMVIDIPVISDVAFYPFARDARIVYQLLSGAVGTSEEYAKRPAKDRETPYPQAVVYVGNNLATFDAGAAACAADTIKPDNEFWVTYAGTLGASYDLATLIRAAALIEHNDTMLGRSTTPLALRIKILGDGPERESLEALAQELDAPVDFLGYQDYDHMAAYLCASDATINSLVKSAVQSIVTKIGDYLASSKPMINTGSSPEFRAKVATDGFGFNVDAEDEQALAHIIVELANNPSMCKIMGTKGRVIAETEFDQAHSYQKIVDLIRNLL